VRREIRRDNALLTQPKPANQPNPRHVPLNAECDPSCKACSTDLPYACTECATTAPYRLLRGDQGTEDTFECYAECPAGYYHDDTGAVRLCRQLRVCAGGEYEEVVATGTSDRGCIACPMGQADHDSDATTPCEVSQVTNTAAKVDERLRPFPSNRSELQCD